MPFTIKKDLQNTTQNNSKALITIKEGFPDTISNWIEAYFRFEVTTSQSSQKVQRRDLTLFRDFLFAEAGSDQRRFWTPRLSKAFKDQLKKVEWRKGKIGYSDRTINRTMAHLKTFAKWIHKISPFPLGNPMAKLKLMPVGTGLEVERAITPAERRRILDAADNLPVPFGISRGDYLGLFTDTLSDFAAQMKPQLVLLSAGAMVFADEPIAAPAAPPRPPPIAASNVEPSAAALPTANARTVAIRYPCLISWFHLVFSSQCLRYRFGAPDLKTAGRSW